MLHGTSVETVRDVENINGQPKRPPGATLPPDGFPNANRVMDRSLSLPTHQSLTSDDVGYLVEVVDEVFGAPS